MALQPVGYLPGLLILLRHNFTRIFMDELRNGAGASEVNRGMLRLNANRGY
jgi:hypothetical protein